MSFGKAIIALPKLINYGATFFYTHIISLQAIGGVKTSC